MGFSSGLPFALVAGTLQAWLKDAHVSLTAIGLFALVRSPYSVKFVWSPIVDRVALPVLGRLLGRRRSWALVLQLALMATIAAMGATDPALDPWRLALLAMVLAFFSASQDIVIDAYRVELLDIDQQGAGAAATQLGYRVGLIASSAGALYAASFWGWAWTYWLMAALVVVGMATVLMTREPALPPRPSGDWLASAVIAPFADFMTRRAWLPILCFVVLYKFGDAFAGNLSTAFYLDLGFSKEAIASVSKIFGVVATMAGVAVGGVLVARVGVMRGLLIGGVLQTLSIFMYVVQVVAGADVAVLAFTIAIENVTLGMASAAFVAYLSDLCSPAFTATQYALLSALATFSSNTLVASSGWFAEHFGWIPFFLLSIAACIPGLLLLLWLMRRGVPLARAGERDARQAT
jgi:MFS transporter, PAT family, beta-lactamase induction signal transducer AmpG